MGKINILDKAKNIKIDRGTAFTVASLLLSVSAAILSGMNKQFEIKKEYDAVLDEIVDKKIKKALKNR